MKLHSLAVLWAGLAALFPPASAATLSIDFSTVPPLAAQPNNFAAAGAMQTYNSPGVYTIAGGVVLGNVTSLASFPTHGSAPNLYGTADFADPSLLDTIALTFPAALGVTSVTGVLFNGQTFAEDYRLQANGANTQNFLAVEDNSSTNSFRNWSYTSIGTITSITITSPNSGIDGWDFFIDDVNLTFGAAAVPEPSTLGFALVGVALTLSAVRKRNSR